jgi:flagellar basal-body rod protein FlgB
MYIFLFIIALIYSCLSDAQIPMKNASAKQRNLFSEVEENMNYALERHKILSENIASQDIPGYRAKDLNKGPLAINQKNHLSLNMHTTSKLHITPKRLNNKFRVSRDKYNTQTTFRKNNVDLSDQMVKVNQNLNEYNLSTSIYKKMHGLLKVAIGK